MRANERSERPSGPLKTRLSVTRSAPTVSLSVQLSSTVSISAGISKSMSISIHEYLHKIEVVIIDDVGQTLQLLQKKKQQKTEGNRGAS